MIINQKNKMSSLNERIIEAKESLKKSILNFLDWKKKQIQNLEVIIKTS